MPVFKHRCGAILSACAACLLYSNTASAYVISDLTEPGIWSDPCDPPYTSRVCVSWSLMGEGPLITEDDLHGNPFTTSSIPLSEFMPEGFLAEIEAAFAAWSAVADIDFMQVADDDAQDFNAQGSAGDIRIGGHPFSPLPGLAHGYFPPENGISAAGDIHFDSNDTWSLYDHEPGYTIFRVATHEIGHAIGLDHQDASITALMNPVYTEETPMGLLQDDIAGVQYLYGPRTVASEVPESGAVLLIGSGLLMAAYRRPAHRRKLNRFRS